MPCIEAIEIVDTVDVKKGESRETDRSTSAKNISKCHEDKHKGSKKLVSFGRKRLFLRVLLEVLESHLLVNKSCSFEVLEPSTTKSMELARPSVLLSMELARSSVLLSIDLCITLLFNSFR